MAMDTDYSRPEPTRAEVDATAGPLVLEFGTDWCGLCRELQPRLAALLAESPTVAHRKVEDGRGRPLGRSFRVKLWPTLVFLRDGTVMAHAARPDDSAIQAGLAAITTPG